VRKITASAGTTGRATAGRQAGVIFEHPKAMPASRPVEKRTTSGNFGVVSRSLPVTHLGPDKNATKNDPATKVRISLSRIGMRDFSGSISCLKSYG
jgi:hypothetical protein